MAGKGNDVCTIDQQKWDAATWKKVLMLEEPTWGIDVPSCRIQGHSPPFGSLILFFCYCSGTPGSSSFSGAKQIKIVHNRLLDSCDLRFLALTCYLQAFHRLPLS